MNFKKNVYFLGLQKYLSLEELIIYLGLNTSEIIDLTKMYGREYPKMKRYFEKIFLNKFILPAEVIGFIHSNLANISFQMLLNNFKIKHEYLVNMLYYYASRYPEVFSDIITNERFHQEIREAFTKICIDRANNQKKIFKNNAKNLSRLERLSKTTSIEEISLIFSCSPKIVEDELIENGIGGFWYNENIRTNYPYFVSDIKNRFSVSEIIYIARHHKTKKIEKKMKTTPQSIEAVLSLIKKINIKITDLGRLLVYKDPICHNWIYIKELLMLEKENNKYLFNYSVDSLFSEQDLRVLEGEFKKIATKLDWIKHMSDFGIKKYLVVTKDKSLVGNFVYKNNFYSVYEMNNKTHFFHNEDILLYKKINEWGIK